MKISSKLKKVAHLIVIVCNIQMLHQLQLLRQKNSLSPKKSFSPKKTLVSKKQLCHQKKSRHQTLGGCAKNGPVLCVRAPVCLDNGLKFFLVTKYSFGDEVFFWRQSFLLVTNFFFWRESFLLKN